MTRQGDGSARQPRIQPRALARILARRLARPLTAVAAALVLAAMLIAVLGENPWDALTAMWDGAVGGPRRGNLQATLERAAMVTGCALAAGLALRCGFLNIGVEGQMVLGGVTAALLAVHGPMSSALPAILGVPVIMLCAALAGGLWALCAAFMQLRAGVPLVIGSLLLNYPASYLASWLVSHPYRDVATGMAASGRVPRDLRLPGLGDGDVHFGVVMVAVLALSLALFFRRTGAGYEARMTGLGPRFARASGVRVDRLGAAVVFSSGAIAGLVGAVAVLGEHHRYIDGMLVKPLYAWTGIMAVLLGGAGIPGLLLAGTFFAGLTTGAMGMERAAQVPREIARVIVACIVLFIAATGVARLGREAGEDG